VEVVVVVLIRPERRGLSNEALSLRVVDEAERRPLRAALRVGPPVELLDQLRLDRGGDLLEAELGRQLVELGGPVERLAAEVVSAGNGLVSATSSRTWSAEVALSSSLTPPRATWVVTGRTGAFQRSSSPRQTERVP
jgi:hypothetical protein